MKKILTFLSSCLLISVSFAQTDCANNVLSTANNKFAINVYKQLLKNNAPVFFSPYSIYTALAMTAAGAKDKTATEMQQILYSPTNATCMQTAIGNSQKQFNQLLAKGDSFRTVNSLWVQKGLNVLPAFYKTTKDVFNAEVNQTDFLHDAEISRKAINGWVEKQTNDRIKDLLQPGTISKATKMILVNAIWFKGKWKNPFNHDATYDESFHATKDDVNVPFMHQEKSFKYTENESLQVVEMPYQSNKISMIVLLPAAGKEADLEKALTQQNLDNWLKGLSYQNVNISLPKFKMETSFMARDILEALGMKIPFGDKANFSGISQKAVLSISNVIHKAFIEVDESGTEAAAATAVIMVGSSAMPVKKIVKEFKADRPFTFLLCDSETKMILFMGKVEKP